MEYASEKFASVDFIKKLCVMQSKNFKTAVNELIARQSCNS